MNCGQLAFLLSSHVLKSFPIIISQLSYLPTGWAKLEKQCHFSSHKNDCTILTQLINPNKKINLLILSYVIPSIFVAFGHNWQQWSLALAVCNLQTCLVAPSEPSPNTLKWRGPSGSSRCLTCVHSRISANFHSLLLRKTGSVLPQAFAHGGPHLKLSTLSPLLHTAFLKLVSSESHQKYLWVFKSVLWEFLNHLFLQFT